MKGIELEEQVVEVIEPEVVYDPLAKPATITSTPVKGGNQSNTPQTITQAAAQNFGRILDLAGSIVEIGTIKVKTDALLAEMEAKRKQLITETEAYVEKKNADTNDIIAKMNVIRLMMQDFYQQSNKQITGEDFRQIITSIVDQMGRMTNE